MGGKIVRRTLAGAALVSLVGSLGGNSQIGAQSFAAGQRAIDDALAQIASRSPGDRIAAVFAKWSAEANPVERDAKALPRIRAKPKADDVEDPPSAPVLEARPLEEAVAALYPAPTFAEVAFPQMAGPEVMPPIEPGAFVPGIGGGGVIGPGGGSGPPPNGAQPAPAVPEPGTWASLIIGFAIVGAAIRRRKWSEALGG